jgi:hypothetical protein
MCRNTIAPRLGTGAVAGVAGEEVAEDVGPELVQVALITGVAQPPRLPIHVGVGGAGDLGR